MVRSPGMASFAYFAASSDLSVEKSVDTDFAILYVYIYIVVNSKH